MRGIGFGGANLAKEETDVSGDAGIVIEAVRRGTEGDDGEVAVVTASAAEGKVDIDGRRKRWESAGVGDCR